MITILIKTKEKNISGFIYRYVTLSDQSIKTYLPYLVIVSVKVRKVIETIRLQSQLVAVANELPVLLAQRG